jgi:hypothetical protein
MGIDLDKIDVFPRKTHIHGKHYRCFIWRTGKTQASAVSFDFWNSYADTEFNAFWHGGNLSVVRENIYWDKYAGGKPYRSMFRPSDKAKKTPQVYDLLTIIQKTDPGTFEEFCSDFGYDSDSRRAERTWQTIREEYQKVSRFFTKEEMETLQEIQ